MLLMSSVAMLFFSICIALFLFVYGVPQSLSETYYILGGRKKFGGLFYMLLIVTSMLLLPSMVELNGALGFLCGASLCFVGAAAAFKDDKVQRRIHMAGTGIASACAMLFLFLNNILIFLVPALLVCLILSLITRTFKRAYTFWLEMVAFYSIMPGLIYLNAMANL